MNDATMTLAPPIAAAASRRAGVRLPFSRKTLLAVGGAVVLALAGAGYIIMPARGHRVSTDVRPMS